MPVKVPPLLHKMSLSAQKAWYKKNNMEMPASKPNEVAGKSAAAAKKVKVAPRTVAAIEPNSVRAINAARQKEYMAKGGRQPIGAAGSGGNSSMAGSNMSTAKGIVAGIKAGFNPKVSLDPYESERAKKVGPRSLKLKKESVDEALSPERKRMFDLKLKYIKKAANRKDRAKPSKVDTPRTALNPAADMKLNPKPMDTRTWDYIMKNEEAEQIEEGNPANKAKKKEAIRQLGLKAMAAGKVDKARGYIPQRAGREMLKKEEAEMNEVTKAEAEKVLGGPVKTKPKMPPGKQPAGYRYVRGLARKAMKAGMKKDEYDSPARKAMERELQYNPKYRMEEVEQIDEVDYEKYLKVSQEKRPVKIGAVMAARKAEKQGDPNPIRKLANTQKAQRFARNQLAKKAPPKPYTPNPNPYGYGEGRYMGDSVENNGDVLDEGKVAKALAVGAMTLASMGAKAHTDTTKSVAQLAKERPALAQRLKDIGATGQVPASDKRAAELQRKQDQEMPASERRAKELEKMKKEETEESTMKYIEEKLTASDPASKWISDFVKSDNPKFAGKSKKERIQQALGAYYAKKRGTNEEVELDESHGAEKLGDMLESDADHETKMKRIKIAPTAHLKYLHKYNMGYSGGGDHPMIKHIKDELKNRKMKNEEVEQIYEGKAHDRITAGLKDENKNVRVDAILHPKATPEHISIALKDEHPHVREAAIRHRNATPEHISAALKDDHMSVRKAAIKNRNASSENISAALKDGDIYTRMNAIKHRNVKPEHIAIALKDKESYVRDAAKNRMKKEEVFTEEESIEEAKQVDHAKTVANSLAATHPNFRVSSYNGDHGRAHVVHHKSDTRNFKNGEQLMGPNIQLQHNHKTNKVHMEMQGDYDNVPDRDEETHHPDKAHEAAHKMFKPAIDLIHKTDKKTTNEEVEQMDEGIILEGNLSIRALYNKYADHYTSSEGNSAKRADAVEKTITKVHGPEVMNHLKKAVKANLRNDMDQEENHFERARNAAEKSGSDRVNATVGKNRSKFRKEEVVLEEPKDAADVGEYDYEGDMAKSQLRSIMANSKRMHDMLEDTTNLPEWVQSKITLAEDYVVTAANYMEGEMNEAVERVDELKKSTLQSYAKKASKEMKKAHDYHQMRYGGRDGSDSEYMKKTYPAAVAKYDRRDAGVAKAKQKIAKEEVEQMDEAIRGYIKSEPGNEDGTAVRRPADQAERNQLARNLIANRKYNLGKKIGKKSGSVRKNAAGMTPSQKISTALRSPEASKKLDPKEFPYMPKNAKITPFLSKEEAEGKVAVTPKEKSLAAHHGDPKKITYGDVIKARLKSAAAKKMGK